MYLMIMIMIGMLTINYLLIFIFNDLLDYVKFLMISLIVISDIFEALSVIMLIIMGSLDVCMSLL
jgi:hypothetical protein